MIPTRKTYLRRVKIKQKKIRLWNEKYIITKKLINVKNNNKKERVFIRKCKQ